MSLTPSRSICDWSSGRYEPASGDHADDPRDAGAQRRHRPGEDLEPLLVLHPSPREHDRAGHGVDRAGAPDRIVGIALARLGSLVAGADAPPARVDTVRNAADDVGVELEPAGDLANHQPGAGDDAARPERQPPLDGVDVGRVAEREVATVAAALGAVQRGHERHVEQSGQHFGGPADVPVVGVDDVGHPVSEPRRPPDERVIGGRCTGDLGIGAQPRHVDVGPHDPDPVDDLVDRARRVGSGEQHDVVAGARHRPRQAVDVGRHAAGGTRRVLPRKHQDAHGRAPYPGGMRRSRCQIPLRPPI